MLLTGSKNEETYRFYESAGFDRHAKQAFLARPGKAGPEDGEVSSESALPDELSS